MPETYREITEQEKFWKGEFGDSYTLRNQGDSIVQSNKAMFSKIFKQPVDSLIEMGANIGLNLQALQLLFPDINLAAVEINPIAADKLREQGFEVCQTSILDFEHTKLYEVALSKGVLIHINPKLLPKVYEKLYHASSRYICLAEYYSPHPVEINYRGHESRLFKRDFAGEMLDQFEDLTLVDYGFVYHRDGVNPQDDLTWFLMEKQ